MSTTPAETIFGEFHLLAHGRGNKNHQYSITLVPSSKITNVSRVGSERVTVGEKGGERERASV